MRKEDLVKIAGDMRQKAYVPYSKYQVGAAILCKDGSVYTGCNVENASYGMTICGERTALVKAVSEGNKDFDMLAVISNSDEYCMPCGACRQMLDEFAPDLTILCAKANGEYKEFTMKELLPYSFSELNEK